MIELVSLYAERGKCIIIFSQEHFFLRRDAMNIQGKVAVELGSWLSSIHQIYQLLDPRFPVRKKDSVA